MTPVSVDCTVPNHINPVYISHWYLPLVLTGAVFIGLGGEAVPEIGSEEAGDTGSRAAEEEK